MSFVPGSRGHFRAVSHRHHGGGRSHRHWHGSSRHARPSPRHGSEREGGEAAEAKPGGGFKVIDGVLTYPAPARFQPKNLPH
jgi:hypothetical protein